MTTLSELFSRRITPPGKDRHKPNVHILPGPIQTRSEQAHGRYEAEVFNYLLKHKDVLGIRNVMKFTALLVDGAVELTDGKRLAVEIKFRMNWEKACQAEWEFRGFLKRTDRRPFDVDGGLVFFEEFSGDWQRRDGGRPFENGWLWYGSHSDVEGLPFVLLRLRGDTLEGFPSGGFERS